MIFSTGALRIWYHTGFVRDKYMKKMHKNTVCRLRTLPILVLILSGCSGGRTLVKEDALNRGKIEVSTVAEPETHEAGVVLAVIPFANNTGDDSLASVSVTLSRLISVRMASYKGYKVVERQRLEAIMGELKLGMTGAIDPATALEVGKLLGANVLAFGSFSRLGGKAILSMRLVNVGTGEIIGGIVEKGKDFSELDVLADKAAGKLAEALSAGR